MMTDDARLRNGAGAAQSARAEANKLYYGFQSLKEVIDGGVAIENNWQGGLDDSQRADTLAVVILIASALIEDITDLIPAPAQDTPRRTAPAAVAVPAPSAEAAA